MKFVIEFDDDDIGEFIEEFGDDIKESIKKRFKKALDEEDRYYADRPSSYPVTEMTFGTKEEAEDILTDMYDILTRFDRVTVFDYYDLAGCTCCSTMDRLYGWTDLKGASVRPTYKYSNPNFRWTVELPKPVRLHRYDQVK